MIDGNIRDIPVAMLALILRDLHRRQPALDFLCERRGGIAAMVRGEGRDRERGRKSGDDDARE